MAGIAKSDTGMELPGLKLQADQIGGMLAYARRERGLTIEHVSAELRIPKAYIHALEQCDYDALPGVAYIPGYLRSYSRLLDIQPTPLIEAYQASLRQDQISPAYEMPLQKLTPKVASSMVAMVFVLALMAGYAAWYVLDRNAGPQSLDDTNGQIAAVEDSQEASATNELANGGASDVNDNLNSADVAATDQEGAEASDASAANITTAQTESEDSTQIVASSDDSQAETALDNTQTTAVAEASVPTPPVRRQAVGSIVADETPAAGSAQANPVSPASTLLIRATSPSWVEIVRDDGQVVVSKLLRTGDQLTATLDEELYLSSGNAGGLMLEASGLTSFRAGKVGEILRDLPLTRDGVRLRQSQVPN